MIVYGGELDAINGVLRQTYNLITFTGASGESWSFGSNAQSKGRVWIKIGVAPESVTVATGSITMTFEAQESALGVKVRVY